MNHFLLVVSLLLGTLTTAIASNSDKIIIEDHPEEHKSLVSQSDKKDVTVEIKDDQHIQPKGDLVKNEDPKKTRKKTKIGIQMEQEELKMDLTKWRFYKRMACCCGISENFFHVSGVIAGLTITGFASAAATGYLPTAWGMGLNIATAFIGGYVSFANSMKLFSASAEKNLNDAEDVLQKQIENEAQDVEENV
jgi:hypothetical protein